MMKLLAELNEKEKKTIIVVTHSPGGLEYAHRVFYMKDGQIINIQENRKVGQPLKKEVLESNVLADDLELDEKKKKGGRKTTEALVASSEGEHMLADIKAREIITEALTNLSTHELDKMVSLVSQMITKGSEQKEFDLLKYLDDGVTKGGLGFDTRTAHHITEKIKQVVDEIQELHGAEEKARRAFSYDISPEITSIRHYIFEQFDIQLRDHDAIINFDNLMRERLSGDIDEKGVSVRLNMRVEEGGVGLDKRVVHKIAKRVELLVLGKI
jgi:ABC-type glutathione transport system ATPase component